MMQNKYQQIDVTGRLAANDLVILDSRVHGLFACFYCILYGLYICEKENLRPIVYLGANHLYYDDEKGNNIFEYYYENSVSYASIDLKTLPKIVVNNPDLFLRWCRKSILEQNVSNFLINKYFLLKGPIREIIDAFVANYLVGYRVLGVHYRGTDKVTETELVLFREYENKIEYLLSTNIIDKFYFSSDEIQLKNYVKQKYDGIALVRPFSGSYDYAPNSSTGLHFSHLTPYLSGLDAIMDCYILSKCCLIMSSSKSSLSLFSSFISPNIPHIILEA
jgi:hypothetical protein